MGVMNVATYGYTMLAAYFLGPQRYSAFVALLNLLLVVSVVSLGLQAAAARRISASPEHLGQIQDQVLRVSWRTSLAVGGLLLASAPLVDRLLRLDDLRLAVVVAVGAVPLTMMGGQAGTLQGERRWTALGWVYVAAGVPRLVVGTWLLLWRPSELWALVAVAIGFCAPVVVGWFVLRHEREPGEVSREHRGLAVVRESLHNSQALFAYFALSTVDIVVARNVLPAHDSGLYAAGLIMTKAMLFLPQFVVVVAFPAMSTPAQRRLALTRSMLTVTALGAIGAVAAWLLDDPLMVFVGGHRFHEIRDRLWVFAVLGSVLSMLQLLVYAVLARQGRRSIYLVWAALVTLVALGLTTNTLVGLVTVVLTVDIALLVVLIGVSLWLVRAEPAGAGATR
jgi:O-antigen/teichoic acid export membrane protein